MELKNETMSLVKTNIISKDVAYKVGQIVQHSLFGKGKVIEVQGEGNESKLSIIFNGNIRKKLIAKYANLKIVYE